MRDLVALVSTPAIVDYPDEEILPISCRSALQFDEQMDYRNGRASLVAVHACLGSWMEYRL
jgi:hypothetical protein